MQSKKLIIFLVTLIVILSGCASTSQQSQEQSGMVIGAILGGVLGSHVGDGRGRTAATIVGAIIGSSIGGNIGRSMDDTDRLKTAQTLETVRTGVPSSWVNPDTNNHYTVIPTRTYEETAGSPCREFTMNAVIGGEKEKIYGTACRQADGSWKVQD